MAPKNKPDRHTEDFERKNPLPDQGNVIHKVNPCDQGLVLSSIKELQQSLGPEGI